MLTYDEMQALVYTHGDIPDGYFGDKRKVGFAYNPENGRTYCVADCGYFPSGLPVAVDARESEWLLNHSPHSPLIRADERKVSNGMRY